MPKRLNIPNFLRLLPLILGLSLFVILLFSRRYFSSPSSAIVQSSAIKAAIIPHHLVADVFMKDLAQKLLPQSPQTIIIIGPNHDETGDGHFLTDNPDLANDNPLIHLSPELTLRDHACYAPRGVLQNSLTSTKFSCVLVSSRASVAEIEEVTSVLTRSLKPSGVLVASVDFSHYLTLDAANFNDAVTQKLLAHTDFQPFLKLSNGFLDSPKTITLLFTYLNQNKVTDINLINHSNSALILNDPSLPSTTSYFEVIYR